MASPSDLSRIAIVATTAADSSGTIVVDAAGRRWHRQGVAASVNVMWFGAKGDWNGTTGTDDTAAIQAAIVALPAEGGEVVFPPKSFLISSPIKLGNGSTSASSTRNGIILRGVAGAMSPFAATLGVTFASAGTEIIWAPGAASAWMIQVLGPVQGCGLKNIFLNGRGIANGIQLLSASFGDYENVAVENCTGPSLLLDTNRAGVSINTMTNRFHNLFINLPDAASTQGIVLDGDTTQNACFNDFQNVLITLAATHVCWGVYLRGADSNTFRDVLIYGGSSAAIAVLFDYTGTSYFPCANSFYDIDPYGAGAAANIQQWVNNGYPSTGTRPNYIYGLNEANGASPPNIPALVPSLPNRSYYVSVPNSVSAICSSCLYTPPTDGLYRVSYAIMTTIAGTSGSIQLFVGANNAGTVQSYSANNISANTVGSATSGDFVVFSSAGYAMDYQVNFNWVVGTPKYSLYISVERLQ